MEEISVEEVIQIHNKVVKRFGITEGIINKGVLEAVIKRPELQIGGHGYIYKSVFTRAAALLEGIIRMHPFADGNKRTALLTMVYYLKLENYSVALPLSAVRYTVNIAKNNNIDNVSTMKLINTIAYWINQHSGQKQTDLRGKLMLYIYIPYKFLNFLIKIGFKGYVQKKLSYWLALDIYPEYASEAQNIFDFINETITASFGVFEM